MKPECERQPASSLAPECGPMVRHPRLCHRQLWQLDQSTQCFPKVFRACAVSQAVGCERRKRKEKGLNEIDVVNVPGPLLSMSRSAVGAGPNAEPPSSQVYSPRRLREVLLVGTCCSERAVTLDQPTASDPRTARLCLAQEVATEATSRDVSQEGKGLSQMDSLAIWLNTCDCICPKALTTKEEVLNIQHLFKPPFCKPFPPPPL